MRTRDSVTMDFMGVAIFYNLSFYIDWIRNISEQLKILLKSLFS